MRRLPAKLSLRQRKQGIANRQIRTDALLTKDTLPGHAVIIAPGAMLAPLGYDHP